MRLKSWRRVLAGLIVGSLILLAVHDLAHAREQGSQPCQVCALVARTAAHAPKIAPVVVSRFFKIALVVSLEVKPANRRADRAAARDPPTS